MACISMSVRRRTAESEETALWIAPIIPRLSHDFLKNGATGLVDHQTLAIAGYPFKPCRIGRQMPKEKPCSTLQVASARPYTRLVSSVLRRSGFGQGCLALALQGLPSAQAYLVRDLREQHTSTSGRRPSYHIPPIRLLFPSMAMA